MLQQLRHTPTRFVGITPCLGNGSYAWSVFTARYNTLRYLRRWTFHRAGIQYVIHMETSTLDFRAFAFIITLAAVVNGLGIVRWLTAFSEYLRRRQSLDVQHYWVYNLMAAYQFLLHILLWWTLWGIRDAANFNFLTYLYLLIGPVLLFLGTSLLTPSIESDGVDIRRHFSEVRRAYSTVLTLLWLWAIFSSPVIRGFVAPTAPLLALFLAAAVTLRTTANPKIHGFLVVLNWLLVVVFVGLFAMPLGGWAT
jgi:hypothetical protein